MNQQPNSPHQKLPRGSYPAMLTAFHDNGEINWNGIAQLTEHCIATGAAGIFACGLSAEILQMSDEEIAQLAEHIIKQTAGRVPIIASAISSGPIETQADLVNRVHNAGADVVAIGVCQLAAETDSDQTWIENAEKLLQQISGSVRLAMYECPLPYHRLLSTQTLEWAAKSGRFHFLKDTCCSIETIRDRLKIIAGTPLQLFNANTETLLASLQSGVDGFCGIGANYQPELYAWLCENYETKPDLAIEVHKFLDSTIILTEDSTYPASAKNFLQQRGLAIGGFSRKIPDGVTTAAVPSLERCLNKNAAGWKKLVLNQPGYKVTLV